MVKRETVMGCYKAWSLFQQTGKKKASCDAAGVGITTLERFLKDYNIESEEDWKPVLAEYGLDKNYLDTKEIEVDDFEADPPPQKSEKSNLLDTSVVKSSVDQAVGLLTETKRIMDGLPSRLYNIVTPLGAVSPGGAEIAPPGSSGGKAIQHPLPFDGDPFEYLNKEVEKAKEFLQRAGMKVVDGKTPASLEEAQEMLKKFGYIIKDPRMSLEDAQKMIETEKKRWDELHNEKIEVQLEQRKIDGALQLVDGFMKRFFDMFQPAVNKWFEVQQQKIQTPPDNGAKIPPPVPTTPTVKPLSTEEEAEMMKEMELVVKEEEVKVDGNGSKSESS